MKKSTELVYVELKSGYSDNGPAWIGKASFSKTGKTVYFDGKAFKSAGGTGVRGNFYESETGDEYWISGVKKNGMDRHWAGFGKIYIDKSVVEDYLVYTKSDRLQKNTFEIVELNSTPIKESFNELENEEVESFFDSSLMHKFSCDLTDEELTAVYEQLLNKDLNAMHLKARKSWRQKIREIEAEIEKRKLIGK